MPVLHLDPAHFKREYGALCHRYFPQQHLNTPYGASYCVIGPNEATDPHEHHEGETFFIVKGRGEMAIVGEAPAVITAGEVVYIPAHARHVLRNLSDSEELALFSVWFDDGTEASAQLPGKSLVIVAAPTPNGKLHLGHLSGPYVASDVYTRYLKLRQVDVHVACGSDDNQSYTETKARQLGMTAQEVTARFSAANEATMAAMGMEVEYFLRPSRAPGFDAFVQAFLRELIAKGAVVAKRSPTLWCPQCDLYLYEAHVKGGCPHCGEPTSGNGCEACAIANQCIDLIDPRCSHCQSPVRVEEREQLFFPLEPHRETLVQFFDEVSMSAHLRAVADTILSRPMPDVAVSHFSHWGIPVLDRPGEVVFAFLEMAAGFLFQAARFAPNPDASDAWRWAFHDANTEVVQFLGIDNTFYFMAVMPAMLKAFDPTLRLPRSFVCNEFFQLEGQKFSTSRNHAVWGDDALAHVTPDALRFALAIDRPEHIQTSFSLAGLERIIQDHLVDGLEGWLADLDARLAAIGHQAPALGKMTPAQKAFADRLRTHAQTLAGAYDVRDFSMRRAARALLAFLADVRDFGQGHRHLTVAQPGRYETALAIEVAAARLFAVVAEPLLPRWSQKLLTALGAEDRGSVHWTSELVALPAGHPIGALTFAHFADSVAGVRTLARQTAAVR